MSVALKLMFTYNKPRPIKYQVAFYSQQTIKSIVVETKPIAGQKPGTSGLRKKVKVFLQKPYTENFVQCIMDVWKDHIKGSTLIVGGDGRYYSEQAIEIITQIAAANGVRKLMVGHNGLLSTPAVSSLIRANQVLGGIILTASHNPGGIDNDFGIKFNIHNGGPAPSSLTDKAYKLSQKITKYRIAPNLRCDIKKIGSQQFKVDGKGFVVEIIDSTKNYVDHMKKIFSFDKLRGLIKGSEDRKFKILLDSMYGVTGVYVKKIFVDELGADGRHNVHRIRPKKDFGGVHPDPNLTYAKDLVDKLRKDSSYDFGAAFDGDGDRNMILGKRAFFVNPSDSLAVIANNLNCIPYFKKNGVKGFARSMPTGAAVDRVAKKLKKDMFEVPTGWKYFGNLMDAGRLSLCGEESFGTSSDHIREKDGIWAVLSWLSIIEDKKVGVEEILRRHWRTYGRNYFTRYDYEECKTDDANKMIEHIEKLIASGELKGKSFVSEGKAYNVSMADNFSYQDPIDRTVSKNQGLRILFADGSRLVFRLSGTGSSGATIRMYIDSYEGKNVTSDPQKMLKPMVDVGLQISQLKKFTGRDKPTVIT